eukprot:scaffold19709_cov61-Attheya_sp.AAC.2
MATPSQRHTNADQSQWMEFLALHGLRQSTRVDIRSLVTELEGTTVCPGPISPSSMPYATYFQPLNTPWAAAFDYTTHGGSTFCEAQRGIRNQAKTQPMNVCD